MFKGIIFSLSYKFFILPIYAYIIWKFSLRGVVAYSPNNAVQKISHCAALQ